MTVQAYSWGVCPKFLIAGSFLFFNHIHLLIEALLRQLFYKLSHDMRFPTMWYVWPAKPQTSLRIHAVWSEALLVAWIFCDCQATDRTSFWCSMFKRRLHRLVWDYTCQNTTLLEITCPGSIHLLFPAYQFGLKPENIGRHSKTHPILERGTM